jgi:SAM-dependent methyltransferase
MPFTRLNIINREIRKMAGTGTILDLGCGSGKATGLILSSMKGNYFVTGLDTFLPDILQAKELGIYSAFILANLNRHLPFAEKTFDIVMLLEVLEHLPRAEGKRLLSEMESVARKGVIVSTPAFLDRRRVGTEDEDTACNLELYKNKPHKMPHINIWSENDYSVLGYTVKRANGVHVSGLPPFLNDVFGVLSSPFSYWFFTRLPRACVAVKKL